MYLVKTFKWKKLTKISPNKTMSGIIGSFIFSVLSVFLLEFIINIFQEKIIFQKPKYFILALLSLSLLK